MQDHEIDQMMQRLQHAFAADEGSFLLCLRTENTWDNEAFVELVQDMRSVCELHTGAEMIERWLADGFWYLPSFVQSWTSHPDFPRKQMPMDLRLACGLLEDLAHWFFTDDCPWEDPDSWLQSLLPGMVRQKDPQDGGSKD